MEMQSAGPCWGDGGGTAMGASEMLAAIVRELMADCRARLAPGDAPCQVSAAKATPGAPWATPEATVPALEPPLERPSHA